jgi:uncharacterized protein
MMAKTSNDSDLWERTIQVTGTGTANLKPDVVTVQLGVRTTASTAREASQNAAKALNAMLSVLRQHGVEDRHIQTGYLNLSPEYQYNGNTPKRIGHSASNTVNVRITTLEKAGPIIDAIVDAGGDLVVINSVNLEASDPLPARTEAQRAALLDARAQAEHMAGVLGATVGTVLQIGQNEGHRPGPVFGSVARAAKVAAAPTPIEAGELTITANVVVIFTLA